MSCCGNTGKWTYRTLNWSNGQAGYLFLICVGVVCILKCFVVGLLFIWFFFFFFLNFYALFLTDEKRYFIDLSTQAYIVMTRRLIQHSTWLQCTLVDCSVFSEKLSFALYPREGARILPMWTVVLLAVTPDYTTCLLSNSFQLLHANQTNLGRMCLALEFDIRWFQ